MIRVLVITLSFQYVIQAFQMEHFDRIETDISSWESALILSDLTTSRIVCNALCLSQPDCDAFAFDNGTCQLASGMWLKFGIGPKMVVFLMRRKKQGEMINKIGWKKWTW